jgi:hypothetical protein
MTGMTMLFAVQPGVEAIQRAKVVGKFIFDVIDRVPHIKDHEGCQSAYQLQSTIRFENISFKYPTAPENAKNVLDSVSF